MFSQKDSPSFRVKLVENRASGLPSQFVGMRTLLSRKLCRFVTKALPFCHKRFAASTSKTGTAGELFAEKFNTSAGNGMVPKSLKWQTFLTMGPCKAKQFTLNSRQSYDSMLARVLGKAHIPYRLILATSLNWYGLLKRLKRPKPLVNSDGTIRRWLSLRQPRKCQQKRSEKRPKQTTKRSNPQQVDGRT